MLSKGIFICWWCVFKRKSAIREMCSPPIGSRASCHEFLSVLEHGHSLFINLLQIPRVWLFISEPLLWSCAVLSGDHVMCGISLLWRLLLVLHFSPRACWLPERAVCSKTCREQPFLTPFPNVTIQGLPVHTPEKNPLHSPQNQAVDVNPSGAGLPPAAEPSSLSRGAQLTGQVWHPETREQELFSFRDKLHPDLSVAGLPIHTPSSSALPVWLHSSRWAGSQPEMTQVRFYFFWYCDAALFSKVCSLTAWGSY